MGVQRRRLLEGGVGLAFGMALGGCGGSVERPQAALRLVNAGGTGDVDLYAGDSRQAAGLVPDAASGYVDLEEARYTLKLRSAGAGAASWSTDSSLDKDLAYSVVAYRVASALRGFVLTENVGSPPNGTARVRVLNLAPEAAESVDVYLSDAAAPLDSATAVATAVGAETLGSVFEVDAGSYRLRITAAGSTTDLRLNLPAVAFAAGAIVTLVLSTASGGMLIDAVLLVQRGAASGARNPSARVRVANGLAAGAATLALGGQPVVAALAARRITGYVLVTAGESTPALNIAGADIATAALTLAPGSDLTLLVHGDAATPQLAVLPEDNRASRNEGEARLRLVHGLNGAGTLALSVDAVVFGSGVARGAAQAAVTVSAGSHALAVTEGAASYYAAPEATLTGAGVYTLFLLGDTTAPLGSLQPSR